MAMSGSPSRGGSVLSVTVMTPPGFVSATIVPSSTVLHSVGRRRSRLGACPLITSSNSNAVTGFARSKGSALAWVKESVPAHRIPELLTARRRGAHLVCINAPARGPIPATRSIARVGPAERGLTEPLRTCAVWCAAGVKPSPTEPVRSTGCTPISNSCGPW